MPPDESRIEELFHEALQLARAERAAFLDRRCEGDADLRRAVEELLQAAAFVEMETAWSEPAVMHEARASAEDAIPGALDRYRLEERIGAGGMGVVYRATRIGDFSKQVAVKIVQHGMDDRALARFATERQILAGLEHPNIARLLDGGTTGDGLPFLVMEFVDGVTIDRYVAERKPSRREALELFRKICGAVSRAHRNLVVHRDLKPGNILVTAEGEPKLLDFGVAKLLGDPGERTQTGMAAITPLYASPEQIRGGAITTASDIYSLGVLLYELLSGQRPYRAAAGALDMARAIVVEEPQPLVGVDEDLATIVGMALRKEPERRYASVDQFSEDIRRYLMGYPVTARPDTRRYRTRKFIGRNRGMIAAAALLMLTLVAGAGATYREARIANRRFNDVRQLAHSYLFEVQDALQNVAGATAARQLVVKRALEYLDRLASESGNDRSLIDELATAYYRVAEVQGRPDVASLGDRAGALVNFRKALAYREQLLAGAPNDRTLGLQAAEASAMVGKLQALSGDLKNAEVNDRHALEVAERVVARTPGDSKARYALAFHLSNLADVLGNPNLPNLGQTKAAIELYRRSLQMQRQLMTADPGDREMRRMVSVHEFQVGQMEQAMNNGPGSVAAFQQALGDAEAVLATDPSNVLFLSTVARTCRSLSLAYVQLLHDAAAARPYSERGLVLFEQLAKADPANVDARIALADGYYGHGFVLKNAKQTREALQYFDRAIETYHEVMRERKTLDPALTRTAYQLRADALFDLGDYARAVESSQKVLEINAELLRINPENASAQRNRGIACSQIGKVHEKQGRWREAREWYGRELEILEAQQKKGTLIPMYVQRLEAARRAVERCDAGLAGSAK